MSKTKKCSRCEKIKNQNEFYNKESRCKQCRSEIWKEKQHTIDGFLTKIYYNQKVSSLHRNHPKPKYSKLELIEWVLSQPNFNELYNNWVKSGYKSKLKPSIDRLNDNYGYDFDNIRLVTWEINNKKSHLMRMRGIDNYNLKPVLQYTKQGLFLKEYYSYAQASRETGICKTSISAACRGVIKTAGGYKWKSKS